MQGSSLGGKTRPREEEVDRGARCAAPHQGDLIPKVVLMTAREGKGYCILGQYWDGKKSQHCHCYE